MPLTTVVRTAAVPGREPGGARRSWPLRCWPFSRWSWRRGRGAGRWGVGRRARREAAGQARQPWRRAAAALPSSSTPRSATRSLQVPVPAATSPAVRAINKSSKSHPKLLDADANLRLVSFSACSGSSTVETVAQVAGIAPRRSTATVTVGGNDVGFGRCMPNCRPARVSVPVVHRCRRGDRGVAGVPRRPGRGDDRTRIGPSPMRRSSGSGVVRSSSTSTRRE